MTRPSASCRARLVQIARLAAVAAVAAVVGLVGCGGPREPGPVAAAAAPHGIFVEDLDRTADPCTDFYAFANGTWRQQHPIPASQERWSRRWEAGEAAKDQLKVILDEVSARTDWPAGSVEQLIGDFYGGCLDQAGRDARGLAPVQPVLAELAQLRTPADVGRALGRLHAIAIAVPFGYAGSSDLHTPTEVIAWLSAGGLGLPDRDYYVKPEPRFAEARAAYLDHVAKLFVLAGHDAATAQREADAAMAIELALAKASLDNVALRDPAATDHAMTLAELQRLTPSFDWAGFFASTGPVPARLNVTEPAFFAEFEHQLATTPVDAWRAYLAAQVLSSAAAALSQPFVDEDFAFSGKYLGGVPELKPAWKRCVEATDALLGEALGKKYTDRYFPPAAKLRARRLVDNILAAMHDTLEQLDWMSPTTKRRALEKLAAINPKVGYPDRWKDYRGVAVSRARYWESTLAARRWNVADNLATIGKPLDRGRWGLTPPTSNAYYDPALNEIVFPAGILQPPAFSLDAVDAVNYAGIGTGIGHEISHGFDDEGAQFDAQGRLDNWWSKADLAQFQARGQCVADQFEHYFIEPGIHHNGKLVLGESIGDLGGVNLAYRAFHKAQQQSPAPTLDGFTPDQQFFLAWGQIRGDATRPETQRKMVQSNPHPVAKFRVLGPLANSLEFRAAFGCKAGDAMVRSGAERCAIW